MCERLSGLRAAMQGVAAGFEPALVTAPTPSG
jgi:hypothetical protein